MTIEAQLADGRVLEFPDGTDPAVIQSTVKRLLSQAPAAAPAKSAGFSLKDLAASFGMGATGGTQAITEAFGADNAAARKLEQATQYLQSTMTPERQAELARQQERMKEAEKQGTLAEVKAGVQNILEAPLQSTAQALGSFVPYLPALFAAPVARAIGLLPNAIRAVTSVAQAAPAVIGTAQGAGAVKGSIYDGVLRAEMEAGTSEKEARDKAAKAQEYFGKNFEQIALGAGLGYGAARFGAERLLTPKGREGLPPGLAKRVGITSAGEAGTEALQAGQERAAENIAQQREGFDVPTFRGVAGAATQEGIMGALGGAPIAAISRPTQAVRPPEKPVVEPPAPPSREQQIIDEITGVTRAPSLEPMSAADARAAEPQLAEDIRVAKQRRAREALETEELGPRTTVAAPPLLDVSRPSLNETSLPKAASLEQLLEKQRQVEDRRIAAGIPTSMVMPEAPKPEKPTTPPLLDTRPLTMRDARNRLLVMKDMLKNEGGDPESLQIVPHPTVPERFAITSLDRPTEYTPGSQGQKSETGQARKSFRQAFDEKGNPIYDEKGNPVMVPSEPSGPGVEIDPIQAYVNRARATNTPAAIRFVRDYDQGLITTADVEQALEAERKAGQELPFTYAFTGNKPNVKTGVVLPETRKPRGERELPPESKLFTPEVVGPKRPERSLSAGETSTNVTPTDTDLPPTRTTGEPGIVRPGGFKARGPATDLQRDLKQISETNSDFAVDSVAGDGGLEYSVSATPTLDIDKRMKLVLTSAEQAAADAIQDRIDRSTTEEEGIEARNLLKNTLRRALARNLADVEATFVGPPKGEGTAPPPTKPPPTEPPPTEPPPPTVEPPKTAEELRQRLPVLRQNKEVEDANKAGNFGALIDALEKSSNPIIQKIGQLSQKIRNQITLKKSRKSLPNYPDAAGLYSSGEDSIIMRSDYAGDEHTSAHEVVHALTVKSILAPNARQRPIVKEIEELYEHVKKELAKQGMGWDGRRRPRKYTRQVYGTANVMEFVAEANTNAEFQFLLMKIPYKGKRSAWTQFTRLVANLLGITDVNALTEIINLTDKLTAIPGRGSLFGKGKGGVYASGRGDREISPIGFYSALSDAVSKVDTKAAPPAGWKTMFQGMVNKGVVKQNELEWTGINDWLDLQQGRVTKDQVKEYLDANGVQVEETQLGGFSEEEKENRRKLTKMRDELIAAKEDFQNSGYLFREIKGNDMLNALPEKWQLRYDRIAEMQRKYDELSVISVYQEKPTKYQNYTLPGGENYREVLLTLPNKNVDESNEIRAWRDKMRAKYNTVDWRRYATEEEIEKSNEIARRSRSLNKEVYKSGHWDQPNVLAHIRINDRTDADGNKVLFVEEIQSDWGQAGKKRGFGKVKRVEYEVVQDNGQLLRTFQFKDEAEAYAKQRDAKILEKEFSVDTGIPSAPFVGKTEGWLNLALKRIMIMAAEGGYDKVAFVNGEQSADRYDLSKSIDRIDAKRRPNGTYEIDVSTKEGKDFNRSGLTPEELEDNVGKEMAQKIIDATASDQKRVRFSGLDLKVGGEGMKTFYDKIVPNAVKKLLPKLGGGQMGDITIASNDKLRKVRDDDGTYAIEEKRFDEYDNPYWEPIEFGLTEQRAAELMKENKRLQQPGFDITSEMRDKVDEGIELFSMEREPAATKEELQASITKAEGSPAQQAEAILNQTGMQPQPPEPDRVKKILASLKSMGENPQLTKESAKTTLKQWTDKLETMAFSGDAAFNNNIRRNLIADLNEHPEIMGLLLEASQSQAVHADALATQFIIEGGIAYDEEAKKFVAVKKEDNFIKLSKSIDALAAKYKIDKAEAERIAHTYFVAKRFKSLAAKQDQRDAEIAELEEKIKAVTSEMRRETDADKRDRLSAERDGYRKQADDLKKAEVYISEDQRAMIEPGMRLADIMPELKQTSEIWQGIRTNAVKALMDGQLWSLELAEKMLDNVDYVPFYRDEQLEEGGGPQEFIRGLQVKATEFRLKGSNAPVHDVFDNMVRWTQYAINRSVRNHKALQMVDIGKEIQTGDRKMVTQVEKLEPGKNIIRVYRNGVQELYEVADPLYMDAFTSISNVAIPSIKFFSAFANMLRNSVVLYPLFSVAQVPQDAFSAMFTSGLKPRYALRIPVLAVKEFVKTLTKTSATHNLLKKYGATGVRDFSAAIARQDVEIAAGLKPPKTAAGKGIEFLSHIAMSADNAIRQAVYEASMQQGLSKAEALEKSFDIINFRRRGSSKMINLLGQVVPFFYAYMSVQRVAMKTISGVGISPSNRVEALKTLATMSGGLMAMSVLYAMLVADDEDYQNTPTAIRDRVLAIPGTGMRIPLRPDMFLLPKVIGEHAYHLITDNGFSDPRKVRKSVAEALVNAVASPMPVPQAIKPVLETMVNYDFFQGKPIVGYFEKQKATERQFTDSTSEFSKLLSHVPLTYSFEKGKAEGISPIVADHLIRGMFGSVGGLFLYTTNFMLHSDLEVERPAVSLRDMIAGVPGTGGFVGKTTENALKNDFYELRDEMARVKATFNDIKLRSPQALEDFINDEKNITRLGLATTTEKVSDELSKIRRAISQISNAPSDLMDAEEKKERIEELRSVERDFLKSLGIKELRASAQL